MIDAPAPEFDLTELLDRLESDPQYTVSNELAQSLTLELSDARFAVELHKSLLQQANQRLAIQETTIANLKASVAELGGSWGRNEKCTIYDLEARTVETVRRPMRTS